MNIIDVVDFTGQDSAIDYNGHGTFVTGILSSTNEECLGIAPDAEIYILKLFTDENVTYSSWFIDAFNFVLDNNIDIVNLSTATKDSQDVPFMEKINELTAAGVIFVSAIGNDGPTPGSAENPGDMPTVIGVGSLSSSLDDVAYFSSRGMTKNSLLNGFGVPKPDILLPGENILSLGLNGHRCELKQGTSFSVPIMTGSIAIALSALDK